MTSAPTPAHNQCPFQRTHPYQCTLNLPFPFPFSLSLPLSVALCVIGRHSGVRQSIFRCNALITWLIRPAFALLLRSLFLSAAAAVRRCSRAQLAACILSKGSRNLFTKHFIVPPKELSSRFIALSRVDHKSLTVLTPVADLYLSQSPLSRSLAPLSHALSLAAWQLCFHALLRTALGAFNSAQCLKFPSKVPRHSWVR